MERGEFVAIMGESKRKTTLLNLLAALDKPTGGQAVVKWKNLGELKEKDCRIPPRKLRFRVPGLQLLDTFPATTSAALVLEGKIREIAFGQSDCEKLSITRSQ